MPLTVQKLQLRIAELGKATIKPGHPVSPLYVAPAIEPMESPLSIDEARQRRLDKGQLWGGEQSTSWLIARLHLPETKGEQSNVLQLHWETTPRDSSSPWDTEPKDALLLQLKATIFLDG